MTKIMQIKIVVLSQVLDRYIIVIVVEDGENLRCDKISISQFQNI
jgi:hypothetical protein